jgi:hypothetical protein
MGAGEKNENIFPWYINGSSRLRAEFSDFIGHVRTSG